MEDSHIIRLFWQRSPRAVEACSEKYGAYCSQVARNLLSSPQDCEECVNDTWLAAWNAMPPHSPQVLRLFLARLTRSLCLNRYKAGLCQKRGGGELPALLDELEAILPDPNTVEQQLDAAELGRCISAFVRGLPRREGDLFLRRYFYGESVGQLALRYSIRENHVSVILGRTRKKLRAHLIQEGYIDESIRSV